MEVRFSMKNKWLKLTALIVVIAITFSVVASGCTSEPAENGEEGADNGDEQQGTENETVQVGMILAGSLGDQSFADAAYSGLQKAKEQYNVKYDYVEAPPGAVEEYGRLARQMADRDKYDLIIAQSSLAAEPIKKVSKDYPDQEFMVMDAAVENSTNVASIIYKQNEGSFLAGVVAGMMTEVQSNKTNSQQKIGFVGGMEIPVIKDFNVGYKEGAKWANSDVEVSSKYVGSFDDVSGAKEAALSIYNNGADVVFQAAGQAGLGVFEAAQEQNKLAIGVDVPQAHIAPEYIVTSMVKQIEASVIDTARALKEDKFEPGSIYVYGVEAGVGPSGIGKAVESNSTVEMPDEIRDKVQEAREKILNGEIEVSGALPWTQYEQQGTKFPWYED